VFIRIRGKQHYLWRAVDPDGHVLDILVQSRRNARAAGRFFRKLLKGLQYAPRVIVTDKLKSYAAAKRKVLLGVEHRQSRYLNNRAEVSHQPARRQERQMQRFKSARHAQRFLSAHGRIHNHFQLHRHRLSAAAYRSARDTALRTWREVAGIGSAARGLARPQALTIVSLLNLTTPAGGQALDQFVGARVAKAGCLQERYAGFDPDVGDHAQCSSASVQSCRACRVSPEIMSNTANPRGVTPSTARSV